MTTNQAIEHFGSKSAVAKVLKIFPQSLTEWGVRPPKLRQLQLAHHSGGKLKADKACLTG